MARAVWEVVKDYDWVLTALFHDYPPGWIKAFADAGYTGDYYWTIVD